MNCHVERSRRISFLFRHVDQRGDISLQALILCEAHEKLWFRHVDQRGDISIQAQTFWETHKQLECSIAHFHIKNELQHKSSTVNVLHHQTKASQIAHCTLAKVFRTLATNISPKK